MALNVRPIHMWDKAAIMDMASAMHKESPRYSKIAFDDVEAGAMIDAVTRVGGGFVVEKDGKLVGMIGGFKVNYFFSKTDKYVADIVVYVNPENRGSSALIRLIHAFEAWAWSDPSVKEVLLGVTTGVHTEKTVPVYERLSYKMTGHILIKDRPSDV